MAALFGNPARSSSKNLVEFRAGKMTLNGKTVSPDKRKGQVYVYQSEDALMHFCWKDRTSGKVEDDLIIFPDDVVYKRVPQCTTGRVYILKFKLSTRKFFFWMQEPKTDKDEDYCTKVNTFLNNPPTPGSGGSGSGLQSALSGLSEQLGDSNMQGLLGLGSLDQQQLLQLLNSGYGGLGSAQGLLDSAGRTSSAQGNSNTPATASSPLPTRVQSSPASRTQSTGSSASQTPRPATAIPAVPSPSPGPRPQTVQLSDLQSILSNIQGTSGEQAEEEAKTSVDLPSVITPEAVTSLLAEPAIREQLVKYLPSSEELPQTPSQVASTLQSPQFQQALSMFSSALQSGQLGPLIQQFGLGEEAALAAARGDVEEFAKALQTASNKEQGKKSDKDDDEPMSLD